MREMCNTPQLRADATDAKNKKKHKKKPKLGKLSRRSRRVCRRLVWIFDGFQLIRKQTNQIPNWTRLLRWIYGFYICYGQKCMPKGTLHSHRMSWPNLATNLQQQPKRQEKLHFQMLLAIFIFKYLWFSVSGYDLSTLFFFEWYLKLKLEFLTMSMAIKFQILALYRFNAK